MSACLLFDLDGTLVDCDELHLEAWQEVLAPYGVSVDGAFYKRNIMGYPNDDITARTLPHETREARNAIAERKEEAFRRRATSLHPAKGLFGFLSFIEELGIPAGVVTNATRENAGIELAGIGLATRFATVVIGYEVAHPKPHPEPYLEGLRRLGGSADRSLAFEDSLSGIRAAMGAGLPVIGLTTGLPAQTLIDAGAVMAIADFDDDRLRPFVRARTGA